MKFVALAVFFIATACAQLQEEAPKPYSFNYVSEGEEGSSSHQETSDGSGTVRGSYSLTDIDGRNRIVEYVAGPEGYSATIRTNEPGTDNLNPADVIMESTAEGAQSRSAQPETRSAQVPRVAARPASRSASRPASRPAAVPAQPQGGTRYVLVPVDDPRARAYYAE